MRKICCKWTCWNRFRGRLRKPGLVCCTPGFYGFPERPSHAHRVRRDRNRSIHQNSVCTEIHRLSRVARCSYPCIDHDRHCRLVDDDPDLVPGLEPTITSDRDPKGITVAVPTSCNLLAKTGSALI